MSGPKGTFFNGPSGRTGLETTIIVEGADDAYFLDAVLIELGADPARVGIKYLLGKTNLESNIADLVKTSAWVTRVSRRAAWLLDSDTNVVSTLRDINKALTKVGLPQLQHGTPIRFDTDRLAGVFLVPSGTQTGNLENYLLSTVAGTPLETAANSYISTNAPAGLAANDTAKRTMQAYLACAASDARGCGRAYGLGEFDHTSVVLRDLRSFLAVMTA